MIKITAPELKHELIIRDIPLSCGLKKADVLFCLRKALEQEIKVSIFMSIDEIKEYKKKFGNGPKKNSNEVEDITGFAVESYWQILMPKDAARAGPGNTVRNARAPKVQADATKVSVKHDFDETFTRPDFSGTNHKFCFLPSGKRQVTDDGDYLYEAVSRKETTIWRSFLKKHRLT